MLINLLTKMLDPNAKTRIKIAQIYKHLWVMKHNNAKQNNKPPRTPNKKSPAKRNTKCNTKRNTINSGFVRV